MSMTKFALEKYRFFPYIAWGTLIGFSFFVFHLTLTLIDVTKDLGDSTSRLEAQVKQPVESITDFRR